MKPMQVNGDNYEMIVALIKCYLMQYVTGGSLHVTLEDGNWSRADLAFCERYAEERKDWPGAMIAALLQQLTDDELAVLQDGKDTLEQVLLAHAFGLDLPGPPMRA